MKFPRFAILLATELMSFLSIHVSHFIHCQFSNEIWNAFGRLIDYDTLLSGWGKETFPFDGPCSIYTVARGSLAAR